MGGGVLRGGCVDQGIDVCCVCGGGGGGCFVFYVVAYMYICIYVLKITSTSIYSLP